MCVCDVVVWVSLCLELSLCLEVVVTRSRIILTPDS
jgi:hypothetical protein